MHFVHVVHRSMKTNIKKHKISLKSYQKVNKYRHHTVMSVCLFALMIVVLVYCVLSIFVILINIILVMYNVDYY